MGLEGPRHKIRKYRLHEMSSDFDEICFRRVIHDDDEHDTLIDLDLKPILYDSSFALHGSKLGLAIDFEKSRVRIIVRF